MNSDKNFLEKYFCKFFYNTKELKEFGLWAFGEESEHFEESRMFFDEWNLLHGNELRLDGNNYITQDAPYMVELWERTKEFTLLLS
jgi:hypothetical protein